jgi:cell wall-associated NlpC family hydrolase
MTPFFHNEDTQHLLLGEAASWLDTPFMPNAAIKQAGVSCQKLVGAIYAACGVTLPSIPEGPMDWAHTQTESLIEQFMAGLPNFTVIENEIPMPGDMLGFKMGGCIHHCGLVVDVGGSFIHCLRPAGVMISNVNDASYSQRIAKIWRPLA